VKSPALGDFKGLWEGWESGQFYRRVFHAFHQAVISTAFRAGGESSFSSGKP
jgi:hypothetical protein